MNMYQHFVWSQTKLLNLSILIHNKNFTDDGIGQ